MESSPPCMMVLVFGQAPISIQFFSFLIINSQMALRPRRSNSDKGKNLILVSNHSDLFPQIAPKGLFERSSSRQPLDLPGPGRMASQNVQLFQNFHVAEQPVVDPVQRYAQECLQYQKFQFDERVRVIIQRMAVVCYHSFRDRSDHPFLAFFVERLLCALSKKLLLNKFQLLFLEYVLEETKWRYDTDLIAGSAGEFRSYVHIYQSENPNGMIRHLQVYLLFCAYYSKKSLNEMPPESTLNVFLRTVSEKFKEKYQEWTQVSGVTKIRINPKVLNGIHRKLTSFQQKEKEYFENYNLIVEEILEISPAYNADKEKSGRKRRKIEEKEAKVEQYNQGKNSRAILPEESDQFPVLPFRKKQTSYMSNVDALDPMAYYNRNNG